MLDDTLPLTPPEWPEWGNPIESKAAYENIMAYSPYDRVEAKAYPNILAVGGLTVRASPIGSPPSGWPSCAT